jgi:hypothetical protein
MNHVKFCATCCALVALVVLWGCRSEPKAGSEIHQGDHLTSFSQEITSPTREFKVPPGGTYTLDIMVKNTGTQPWFGGRQLASVDAGYRWIDGNGNALPIEGNRAFLDRPAIQPGEIAALKLQVTAPTSPGSYKLWVSMVQEGVAWFYLQGAKPLVLQVTIN